MHEMAVVREGKPGRSEDFSRASAGPLTVGIAHVDVRRDMRSTRC